MGGEGKTQTALSLGAITARLGGQARGDANYIVHGVASLASATASQISFIAHPRYHEELGKTKAGIVVLKPEWADLRQGPSILTDDPYLYYAQLSQLFATELPAPAAVHPSAVVEAKLPDSVAVGPLSWVAAGCRIGAGSRIGARCVIGPDVVMGENCLLHDGVTLYAGCHLGHRVILHAGVVLGSDGFGYAPDKKKQWVKIIQTGRVRVGDDVEIGANTVVDRAALDETVIGDGVKLDNLIQVGHNVRIGAHTAIAGAAVIAGGVRIGEHCMIGGATAINSYVTIPAYSVISGGTAVGHSVEQPGRYTGIFPMVRHVTWSRIATLLLQLPELARRISRLENGK